MCDHDGAGAGGDFCLHGSSRDIEALGIGVREHRDAERGQHWPDAAGVADGRADHFASGLQIQSRECGMNSGRARADRRGKTSPHVRGELLLIGIHLLAAVAVKARLVLDRPVNRPHGGIPLLAADQRPLEVLGTEAGRVANGNVFC